MSGHFEHRRGQALLMVTLALFAMFGVLGLAIDLGWSYYIRRKAQTAADSAALAAATQVFKNFGSSPACVSGTVECNTTGETCDVAVGNLQIGCLYAQLNLGQEGDGGRQYVTMYANTGSPVVPVGTVSASYWVRALVQEQRIPQLFSSVLGNTLGNVAADATAAIAIISYTGQVVALGRQHDASPCGTGVDICGSGDAYINATSIYMASNITDAGDVSKESSKGSGQTFIRNPGTDNWAKYTDLPDGPMFFDPMSGKGQPPLPTLPLSGNSYAVTGGTLNCSNPIKPGYYYAVDKNGKATGGQISASGPCTFGNSGVFNQFVFFGGLSLTGNLTFNPGEYILAGACSTCAGGSSSVLSMDKYSVQDAGSSSAGEIFIFTNGKYSPDGKNYLQVPSTLPGSVDLSTLGYGTVNASGGNGNTSGVLNGLNAQSPVLPTSFAPFAPVVWWTDQQSSPIEYDARGDVVTTGPCTTETGGSPSLDNPCTNPNGQTGGPQIIISPGHANVGLAGTVYQPRGGSVNIINGNGDLTDAMQLITGSINMSSGNGRLSLSAFTKPPLQATVVALVE